MKRREFLLTTGAAALAASTLSVSSLSFGQEKKPKILYYSYSQGFEHDPVKIKNDGLSVSDVAMKKIGDANGFEVVCTKDGRVFDGDLDQYAGFAFYTSGNLLNNTQDKPGNAMTKEGKEKFLKAIKDGKGFLGFHSATDTWRTSGPAFETQTNVDPYITMLGAEFISHGPQQDAEMIVTQPVEVPWLKDKGERFKYFDEWYAVKNFNKDMHVILIQDTKGMKSGNSREYNRPPFPSTWARMEGKGRVSYCAMGHRNEFWTDDKMMDLIKDLIGWTLKRYDMDLTPNIDKVCPGAFTLRVD